MIMHDEIRKKLSEIFMYWGLGNIEAQISATISTKSGLTAQQISDEIGYAYSTTINSLNNLRRMGYVERTKKNRRFLYTFNVEFVEFIKKEIGKVSRILKDLSYEIQRFKGSYKDRLSDLTSKIEEALDFLEIKGESRG